MIRWGALVAIAFSGNTVQAQIVPDNTLGGETSQFNPNVDLNGQWVDSSVSLFRKVSRLYPLYSLPFDWVFTP